MSNTKLTTKRACRAVGLHRDRFNEHVAAKHFPCAPSTVAGRARLFDRWDLLALMLFKSNLDDGLPAERAGRIACAVAWEAKSHPDDHVIAYVQPWMGSSVAMTASQVSPVDHWHDRHWSGSTIRKVDQFHVWEFMRRVDQAIEEERNIVGEDDE